MRNVWLVVKHEIVNTLSRRGFWLTTLLFPLLIVGGTVLPQVLAGDALSEDPIAAAMQAQRGYGYVDQAGLIQALPPELPPGFFRPYPDRAAAQAALEAGEIDQYFVIPADFLASGRATAVTRDFNVFSGLSGDSVIEYIADYNLLSDPGAAALVLDPSARVSARRLAPDVAADADNPVVAMLPFAVMFVLFFIITFTGGYMLQSVAKEKENRTVEVLLLSVEPRQLMTGKVLGLGLVALLQMAVWLGGSLLALNSGSSLIALPSDLRLPPSFALLTALYFLLGYLLFASALGALGALAPNVREGTQFTFVIILPLLLPFWLNSVFISAPNGPLATALSLIPLTAPTAMVARMAVGTVPLWQIAASLAGLAVTAYLFVALAGRFFRADTLLSASSLTWRRIVSELRS